ncbi:peroxiredoxin [Psychrosphaera ytuae]|uniref:Glutathione-dependent peroxiredoxin n=1 Tax=Psychrosphaera ytuae TaxID=2820710 RepID=A0A975HH78_9GAMM|nr:peroxiredoxin [Psychrosphaera ytuae]QTH62772.1 peroxiredoxin [Psychrosphaera ytuae]
MISVNDRLPSAQFQHMENGEMKTTSTEELFAGKKVVMFAVPGAFTPTCSEAHLPGFVANADKIKAKGVDSIICVSVNDAFVMSAWGKSQNAEELIMLADGGAEFHEAAGLSMDTGTFGGVRAVRYSMIVEDGVVTQLNVEAPKEFKVSDAETVLAQL